MQGAIACVALATGLGCVLMSFHLLIPGIILAMGGLGGVIWIYGRDFWRLRLRFASSDGTITTPPLEMALAILLFVIAL
jgi:hypothetical protein